MVSILLILAGILTLSFIFLLFGGDKNKKCAWCDSKKITFVVGEAGRSSWRHQNKDGSMDKRFKRNPLLSEFSSRFICSKCDAEINFEHIYSELRSIEAKVWKRTLARKGVGDRKGSDWIDTNYSPKT